MISTIELWVFTFLVFLLGASIGSFINVVLIRGIKGSAKGRSKCPHCNNTLKWYHLIPVFSFLFLKARCGYCHADIKYRYFLFEVMFGILFLLLTSFWIYWSQL